MDRLHNLHDVNILNYRIILPFRQKKGLRASENGNMRLRAATFIPIRKNTPSCFASLFRDAGRKAAARDGRPNLAAFRPTMGGRNSGVKTQKSRRFPMEIACAASKRPCCEFLMFYESILQVAEFIRLPPAFERCVSIAVLRRPYPEAKIRMQSVCLLACQYAVFDHLFQGTPTSFQLSSFQNLPKRPRGDVGMLRQRFRSCKVNIYF